MKTLILPIAGKSSRFENVRPKFMLCHPVQGSMIYHSIKGIHPEEFDKIIVIGLQEHEDIYNLKKGLIKELKYYNPNISVVLLKESTNNQPETVFKGLPKKLEGSIFIKDCDNFFTIDKLPVQNTVITGNLNDLENVNAGNKSYIKLGKKHTIVNIVEKNIISNLFCSGGYYFKDVNQFKYYYKSLAHHKNLYVSHIIYNMILDNQLFFSQKANDYTDWGTMKDWQIYRQQFATIFVDFDGTLVKTNKKRFKPDWGKEEGNIENINVLNEKYNTGKYYIIITTARPYSALERTKEQLKRLNIKYDRLLIGVPHTKRILINDYSDTNPYPTAIAINLKRNATNLKEMLNDK